MPNRQLMGVDDSATYIGLSPWTLRAWAYRGRIASYKISTRLMFDRADLDRIIDQAKRPELAGATR